MLEDALLALLIDDATIGVAARVSPEFARTPTTYPYIVFYVETIDPILSHDGGSGLSRAVVRLECFGSTHVQARDVADAIRTKLQGFNGTSASTRIDLIKVEDGGRDDSIMPDDGSDTPERLRTIVLAIWYADASN